MAVTEQFKCPACGGAIEFDSKIQKMKCPYCDSEFDMQAVAEEGTPEENSENMDWGEGGGSEWQSDEGENLRVYICESCGGELVCDVNTAATSCPYCENPVVLKGNVSGTLRPDLVIPFKHDKDAAMAALENHYKGKRLLPKVFRDKNHIREVKGIYVPFWLFDSELDAHMKFKTTRVRAWSDWQYNYTETSYFSVARGGKIAFDAVPVDGSSKMDDTLMESLEPFDLSEAVDFQTAYLSGFFADKYDVDKNVCILRANERIRKSTEDAFASTVNGYASVTRESCHINMTGGRARYALMPVWLLTTEWNGKKYTFAMNGQTGKLVGDLPMDKGLFAKYFLTTFGIAAAATFLASWLLLVL